MDTPLTVIYSSRPVHGWGSPGSDLSISPAEAMPSRIAFARFVPNPVHLLIKSMLNPPISAAFSLTVVICLSVAGIIATPGVFGIGGGVGVGVGGIIGSDGLPVGLGI